MSAQVIQLRPPRPDTFTAAPAVPRARGAVERACRLYLVPDELAARRAMRCTPDLRPPTTGRPAA